MDEAISVEEGNTQNSTPLRLLDQEGRPLVFDDDQLAMPTLSYGALSRLTHILIEIARNPVNLPEVSGVEKCA